MAREKKITIKFFLHTTLKPVIDGKVKRHPLYMIITYNRKNMTMRSFKEGYYKNLTEVDKVSYPGLLDFEERIVKKTIAYEAGRLGDKFDLKGLHQKYQVYIKGIDEVFTWYMKEALKEAAIRSEPQEFALALNFNDSKVTVETLYLICKQLFSDLNKIVGKNFDEMLTIYNEYMKIYNAALFQYNYPTVIEWLDGSAIEGYTNKLESLHKNDKKRIDKSIALIDNMVKSFTASIQN